MSSFLAADDTITVEDAKARLEAASATSAFEAVYQATL